MFSTFNKKLGRSKVLSAIAATGLMAGIAFPLNAQESDVSLQQQVAQLTQELAQAKSQLAQAGAVDKTQQPGNAKEVIANSLQTLETEVISVDESGIADIYEVMTDRGVLYVTADGRYVLFGSLYEIDSAGVKNLTENAMTSMRKTQLKAFEQDMIVYPAKDEKYVVTVFTDTNCGYCQKLHNEMRDYNDKGITIRYLAFPRGGLRSQTYNEMVSIWCSDDQVGAMDKAKRRQKVPSNSCENTVKEQYELGVLFGVNGTPAMVLDDGSMQPGYLPAPRLISLLVEKDQLAKK